MRVMGLDIHRAFAEAVAWDDGKLKRLGRDDLRHSAGGLGSGRADTGASPAGDQAQSDRLTALAIEQYHPVDPA